MILNRLLPAASVTLWFLLSLASRAEEPGRFEGASPDPPHQRDPWTPPVSTLPKFLVNATTILYDQGLADPRGCEYRTVEIVTGSVWGGQGSIVKQHSWVFSGPIGGATRFMVDWDGLIWPTVSVGDPVDLAADVAHLVAVSHPPPEGVARGVRTRDFAVQWDPNQPGATLGPRESNPLQVSLLLRLGRADLAESVWNSLVKQTDAARPVRGPDQALRSYPYSYLTMANDLAWYHFERAATAIKRGDDAVVLHDAQVLTRLQAGVETSARAMGFPHRKQGSAEGQAAYIDFLGQLPVLLADAERRAREPKRPPIPASGGPDPSARVAALIRDLDQIVVNQWGQPGGVSLGEAATVQALIAEGDAAVEPLIEALRHDQRLTRSVSFWRDFARSRTFLTTYDAAYGALTGILRTTTFSVATTSANLSNQGQASRAEVADRIEAYWNRYKAFPLVERWYQTLANDQANPGSWTEAAGNITLPDNVSNIPSSSAFSWTVTTDRQPGEAPRMRGESLREGHDPTVTALLIKRIGSSLKGPNSSAATALVYRLLAWEPATAMPMVQAVWTRLRTEYKPPKDRGDSQWSSQLIILAHLASERLRLGDGSAASEYAGLIRPTEPEWFSYQMLTAFEPLYQFPDDPILRETAEWIFNDPASRWSGLFEPERRFDFDKRWDLVASSLIRSSGWRQSLETHLGDQAEYATARLTPNNPANTGYQLRYKTKSGSSGSYGLTKVDDQAPGADVGIVIRVADQVAWKLSTLDGAPRFELHWPLARREAAIELIRTYLRRYGSRFVTERPTRTRLNLDGFEKSAFLDFPKLDHPATSAEVADRLAIFSLEPTDGPVPERRIVPLTEHPLEAQWIPPELPSKSEDYRPNENLGRVWQAEEVLESGQWKRYFGFVGNHAIERVPAAQLLFTSNYNGVMPDSSNWEVHYQGPLLDRGTPAPGMRQLPADFPVGRPLKVSFVFRNLSGVDHSLPLDLVRQRDGKVIALANGLHLDLHWAAPIVTDPRRRLNIVDGSKPQSDEEFGRRLELKPEVSRFEEGAASQDLGPGANAAPVELDLRDLFTIDQPGRYRLRVQYGVEADPTIPSWRSLQFTVGPGQP